MKTNSALFISATLTAFILAVLTGVVSAFNNAGGSELASSGSPTQAEVVTVLPTQAEAPATQPAPVGPVQAASLAAQFMNKTDVYSVESAVLNGVNVFKVVFSSGDIVYVGQDGAILSTAKLPPTTVVNNVPAPVPGTQQGGKGARHDDDEGGDD